MFPYKLCLAGIVIVCISCQASSDKDILGNHISGGVLTEPDNGSEPITEATSSGDFLPIGEELPPELNGGTGDLRSVVTERKYTNDGNGPVTLEFRAETFPGGLSAGFVTQQAPFVGEEDCLVSGWYAGDPNNQGWVKGVTFSNDQCIFWSHVGHIDDLPAEQFNAGNYGTFWVPVY